jgi:hypothetical protein
MLAAIVTSIAVVGLLLRAGARGDSRPRGKAMTFPGQLATTEAQHGNGASRAVAG